MRLRRIAYVLKSFPKLSETFISEELAEVLRRGLDVRIFAMKRSEEELVHEVVGRAGLLDRVTYELGEFRAELSSFQPQWIHAHFATEPTRIARELSEDVGCPFSFTAHGHDVYRKAPADFAERANSAAAVITVSEANARHIRERHQVTGRQIHVVPCGVDIERFSPGAVDRDPGLIVCVARMSPVKNLGLLLRACGQLRDRNVKYRCAIIGDGRCRPELEALRDELRLESHVSLEGSLAQQDVIRWWQRASIGTLTSHSEGMPVSLMEAAACGVPVVAVSVGGIPELVADQVTGILTAPDRADHLAAALESLINQPSRRLEMSKAARERAVSRFSVVRQVDQLTAIWEASWVTAMHPSLNS